MTGSFDRLLTESEFQKLDEMLTSQGIGSQHPAGKDPFSPTAAVKVPEPATQHQERIWLAQQQNRDLTLRHALAFKLGGMPEIARLIRAVDTVVETLPELNMRYSFSDEGELLKERSEGEGDVVEIVHVTTREEAISLILARQEAVWISESEPPFKALLIFCLGEVILALVMHRIVEEMCTPEDVLNGLANAYDGNELSMPGRRQVPEFNLVPESPAPVAWLQTVESTTPNEIIDFGYRPSFPLSSRRLAHRHGVFLESDLVPSHANTVTGADADLAAFAARFAHFVCMLGGHEQLDVHLPTNPQGQLGDHCRGFASHEVTSIRIFRKMAIEEAEKIILRDLSSRAGAATQSQDIDPSANLPSIAIRWLTNPQKFFTARAFSLERVPLPTAEIRADIELAIGRNEEGKIVLELVSGQGISRRAGGLMLELFTGFLKTGSFAAPREGTELPSRSHQLQIGAENVSVPVDEDGRTSNRDAIQTAILFEFREALATPDLKPHDDFFDFGGHSLVATRIIGRLLHHHGIEVRFNDLFSNPTASGLAHHARVVDEAKQSIGNGSVEISTGNVDEALAPLALAQMSLWKIYSAFDFNEIFNLPFALDFLDEVDEDLFERAFLDIIERHPGLRTLFFAEEDGSVLQKVVSAEDVGDYKWFWRSGESVDTDRNTEASYCFDLSEELPIRLRFMIDPETGRQILSFLFQHLALDEWSVNLMMDQLVTAYRARATGTAPVWDDRPAPFHEFARKQTHEGVNRQHLAYWTDMLRDAPRELQLFEGEAVSERPAEDGAAGGWVEIRLENEISEGLYELAKENGASLFNVVYGTIAAALQKLGGLHDLVIGTSASGRTDPDYFDTIGYFTTVVAHRVRFGSGATVGAFIGNIKDMINGSMPYTDIPIDLVEAELGMTPGRDHLFDVFIQIHAQNKLNGSLPTADGGRIAFRQVDPDKHESHLGLQFEVMEEVIDGDRSIRVLMSYQAKKYGPEQVETIRSTVLDIFTQFAQPGASLRQLTNLSTA